MANLEENQATKKSWITEGIIIALSPVTAYIIVYYYEAGFLDTFSIPRGFLTLELSSVIFASAIILALALAVFIIVVPLIRSRNVVEEKITPSLILAVMLFSQFLFFLLIIGLNLFSLLWLVLFSVYIFIIFISRMKIYVRRFFNRLYGQEFAPFLLVLVIFCSVIILEWPIGRMEALSKQEFPVIGGSPEMVVLRIYGDKLICAPFDRATKTVEKRFIILNTAVEPRIELSLEKVGPLKPIEENNSD